MNEDERKRAINIGMTRAMKRSGNIENKRKRNGKSDYWKMKEI